MILVAWREKLFPFTPNNICKGFSSTGFHPLNENIYTDADFMPASYSDRPLIEKSPTRIIDQVPFSQPTASGFEVIDGKSPTLISPAIIRHHPRKTKRKIQNFYRYTRKARN